MINLSNVETQMEQEHTQKVHFKTKNRKDSISTEDTFEESRVNSDNDDIFILNKMKRQPEDLEVIVENRRRKGESKN